MIVIVMVRGAIALQKNGEDTANICILRTYWTRSAAFTPAAVPVSIAPRTSDIAATAPTIVCALIKC